MKETITFICNSEKVNAEVNPSTTLLDYLRKELYLTGTKEGCREGDCGACTVLVGEVFNGKVVYKNVNSCLLPLADVNKKHVVTIEGLNAEELSPIQKAFVDEVATQCGFCTPGFIVSLTGWFINAKENSVEEAIEYVAGNICRCTGHTTIKRAINNLAAEFSSASERRIDELVEKKILPEYFINIPKRLNEIENTFDKEKNISSEGYMVSGGTDLFVQKWETLLSSDVKFISSAIDGKHIKIEKNICTVKASTTIAEIEESVQIQKYFPQLAESLKYFGSKPIRNRATVAGNIVNASPIGDMTNILLALNAQLTLDANSTTRKIALKDFYLGYKTLALQKNEMVKEIEFIIPSQNDFFNYEKVSRRTYLDIASVNSTIYLKVNGNNIEEVRISAGGIAPVPLLLVKTNKFLQGKEINKENILRSIDYIQEEISPISDARGSAEYKKLLLRQLIFSHFIKFKPQLINAEDIL